MRRLIVTGAIVLGLAMGFMSGAVFVTLKTSIAAHAGPSP
jgi:hypothetical protein